MGEYDDGGIREEVEKISRQLQELSAKVEEIEEQLDAQNVTVPPLSLLAFLRSVEPGGSRYAGWQQHPDNTIRNSGMTQDDIDLCLAMNIKGIEEQLKVETTRWIQIWVKAAGP